MTNESDVTVQTNSGDSQNNSGKTSSAKPKSVYIGWELPEADRARLMALFPPSYPNVIAHHVTLQHGVPADTPLPTETEGAVIGIADDRFKGVQALVVEIGGTTRRPDGKVYHITWSIDRGAGAKPVHSNDVIRDRGFRLVGRIPVKLIPKAFPI